MDVFRDQWTISLATAITLLLCSDIVYSQELPPFTQTDGELVGGGSGYVTASRAVELRNGFEGIGLESGDIEGDEDTYVESVALLGAPFMLVGVVLAISVVGFLVTRICCGCCYFGERASPARKALCGRLVFGILLAAS